MLVVKKEKRTPTSNLGQHALIGTFLPISCPLRNLNLHTRHVSLPTALPKRYSTRTAQDLQMMLQSTLPLPTQRHVAFY